MQRRDYYGAHPMTRDLVPLVGFIVGVHVAFIPCILALIERLTRFTEEELMLIKREPSGSYTLRVRQSENQHNKPEDMTPNRVSD